jgi:breast cancer 2 susceptibility protein
VTGRVQLEIVFKPTLVVCALSVRAPSCAIDISFNFLKDSSPSSSPVRKRQRLSSPTYDAQIADLSQEDLEAFDALEAQLSQSSKSPKKNLEDGGQNAKAQRVKAITDALNPKSSLNNMPGSDENPLSTSGATSKPTDDPDNPFIVGFTTAKINRADFSTPFAVSFASASSIAKFAQIPHDYEPSPSPEPPQEQSFDAWFDPPSVIPPVAFQTASTIKEPAAFTSGFVTASKKGWIAPSSVALAKAQAKMKDIWDEADPEPTATSSSNPSAPNMGDLENAFIMASNLPSSPRRPALRSVENSLNSPSTPSPLGFPRPSAVAKHSSPVVDQVTKTTKPKPFKPPLLTQRMTGNRVVSSPLNPASQLSGHPAFATAGSRHPLASTPIGATSSDVIDGASGVTSFTTPARIVQRGGVGAKKNGPSPFVTPFKPGMKPGQLGRSQLEQTAKDTAAVTRPEMTRESWSTKERPRGKRKTKEVNRRGVFDLSVYSSTYKSQILMMVGFF